MFFGAKVFQFLSSFIKPVYQSTKTQQIKRRKLLGANEKWKINIEGKDEDEEEEEDYRGGAEEETKEEEQKEGDEGSRIDMESNEGGKQKTLPTYRRKGKIKCLFSSFWRRKPPNT